MSKVIKIKELDLSLCDGLREDILCEFDLSSLETLRLQGVNISSTLLRTLLSKARNLKHINLSYEKYRSEGVIQHDLNELDLSSLETLCVSGSNMSSALLDAQLSKAKNLKK